jgi:tetratricopeptide (TPR) repeat protein
MPDSAIAVHERAVAAAKDPKEKSGKKNNLLANYIRIRRLDQAEAVALELLADPTMDSSARHAMHYNLGCIYSRQGRKALAIEQLTKAVDIRPKQWARSYLDTDPDWDNVRTEPGFLEQRKRLPPGKARD